jgi:hypothetical protein
MCLYSEANIPVRCGGVNITVMALRFRGVDAAIILGDGLRRSARRARNYN